MGRKTNSRPMSAGLRWAPFKATVVYLLISLSWILFSDRIVLWFTHEPEQLTFAQTLKGWLFVLATSALIYYLVRHYLRELQRENARYHATSSLLENTISHIPFYVYWKGADGRYIGCNQRFASAAGVGWAGNIAGKSDADLAWRRSETERIRRDDLRLIAEGRSVTETEERVSLPDGKEATFLASKVPIRDESGQVKGLLCIFSDITRRKEEESALAKSEERLRGLVESAFDVVWEVDIEGRLLYVSERCREIFGYHPQEVLQRPIFDFMTTAEAKRVTHDLAAVGAEGKPISRYINTVLDKQGEPVVVETSGTPFCDDCGRVRGFRGVSRDITEWHQANRQLREAEEKYRSLVETIPHGIEECTVGGVITFTNSGYDRIYGTVAGEAIGKPVWWTETTEESREHLRRYFTRLVTEQPEPSPYFGQARTRDGRELDVQVDWDYKRNEDGTLIGFVSVITDITERAQTERALMRNEERFRKLIDYCPIPMALNDSDDRIIFLNRKFIQTFGYNLEDIPDLEAWWPRAYPDPDYRAEVRRQWLDASERARQGATEIQPQEYRITCKDGSVRLAEIFGAPVGELNLVILNEVTARRQQEELLLKIARGISTETGESFFRELTEHLAETLAADYAFVAELVAERPGVVRSVAIYAGEKEMESFEYDLAGTPCDDVLRDRACSYPAGVRGLFPDDDFLGDLDIEGYAGAPLLDASGKPLGILVVLSTRPLPEARKAESLLQIFAVRAAAELQRRLDRRKLVASEARFRSIFNASPMGMFLYELQPDGELLLTGANRAADVILGIDNQSLVGRTIEEAFPALVQTEIPRIYRRVAAEGGFWKSEQVRYASSGVRGVFEVYAFQTEPGRMACYFSDITARTLAEQARQKTRVETEEARDRLDAILKSVSDGLIVTDPGNRVILMNPVAEKMLACPLPEALSRSVGEIVDDETLPAAIACTREGKNSGGPIDWHLPGGEKARTVQILSSPARSKEGQEIGVITLLRDVTRDREIDRMKSEFISTMSHEFRTPLTSIKGFADLLLHHDELPPEEQREFLGYISERAEALTGLVSDLLDIARIEAGMPLALRRSRCTVAEIFRPLASFFKAQARGHFFSVDLDRDQTTLLVDKARIGQVLENLLSNAVKYSPAGSTVTVRGELNAGEYRIAVTDQGIGMDEGAISRIFDKFYRADASDSAVEGIGLGMSIVKQIVEAHDGEITVTSEPGRGTTVQFTLVAV